MTREETIAQLLSDYKLEINKKKKKALLEMSDISFGAYRLSTEIAYCCKHLDLKRAYTSYMFAKSNGIMPNLITYTNLVSLVAGLGEPGSNNSKNGPTITIRANEPPHDFEAAFVVYSDMKNQSIPLSEPIFSALIRCCSMYGKVDLALELYSHMKSLAINPKLRLFHPLLTVLNQFDRINECFEVYYEMIQLYHIQPTEKEYIIMLKMTLRLRNEKFYDLLDSMMEDIFIPNLTSRSIFMEWFQIIQQNSKKDDNLINRMRLVMEERLGLHGFSTNVTATVKTTTATADNATTTGTSDNKYRLSVVLSNVNEKGVVQCNQIQLNSIDLDDDQRSHLMKELETFAVQPDPNKRIKLNNKVKADFKIKEFSQDNVKSVAPIVESHEEEVGETAKKRGRSHDEEGDRRVLWSQFIQWLDAKHSTVAMDYKKFLIIDGANVGYYKQNFEGAPSHVDYEQIEMIVQNVIGQGYTPLLILHSRHLTSHLLPPHFEYLVNHWRANHWLYETPKGFNDDWFWLFAAVTYRYQVITNDELRDHHFQLLSPKWFSRWRERNLIPFTIGGRSAPTATATTVSSEGITGRSKMLSIHRKVSLMCPKPYSHRSQRVIHRETGSAGYYIPCSEDDQWLCVYCEAEE